MPYKIHSVVNDTVAAGTPTLIPDCTSQSINNNPQLDAIVTAGQTMATHVILRSQRIAADFDTLAIADAIDSIGFQPLCITTDNTSTGLVFYLSAIDGCGAISASGHRSLTIGSGAVVPRRLSCEHRGDASMSFDVVVAKPSANEAIVISDAANLPDLDDNGALYGGQLWTLGKMTVGNVAISEYTSLEIDFGNQVSTRGSQSDLWDSHVEVSTHSPSITIRGIDAEWFKESGGVPIAGLACTHANTIIYLRKRVTGSPAFAADNTNEHIKFTAKGIATIQTAVTGQMHQFTETSLTIQCHYDGTDDPIEVDTTSQIT